MSTLIDRLERETPHPGAAWLDVELARLNAALPVGSSRDDDPGEALLRDGCERLQAILLERRIKRELALSSCASAPEALWGHRFQLTRLQAQAQTLDLENGQAHGSAAAALKRQGWIDGLHRRRNELSLAADLRLTSLDLADRASPCERIVQSALDEAGETMAFLEDMSLRRAVDRLELVGDDLARLSESCREWPRVEQVQRGSSLFSDEILVPSSAPLAGHPWVDGQQPDPVDPERLARSESEQEQHERPGSAWQAGPGRPPRQQPDRAAMAGKAAHPAHGEALRPAVRHGPGKHGPGADPGAFRLDRSRGGARASQPQRASRQEQHLFFAWADLAVCSVFLFEFTLKLVLAPHRTSYFLRHFLIDLVASLPFGFVAHQIELDRMSDLLASPGGGTGSLWRPARIARVARAFRFLRVVLPVVRLTRVGLILLRLAIAWSAAWASCSIATSSCSSPCRPRSPSRATAID